MGEVPLYYALGVFYHVYCGRNNELHRWGGMNKTYRGSSLIRKRTSLGPYRGPMPRALGGS